MSAGWLGELRNDVADYADAALQGVVEAGAAIGAQLGEAAGLIPAVPVEELAAPIAAAFARLQDVTEEAGEAVAARIADALARVQALSAEALAAVGELAAAIHDLFPEHDSLPALPAPNTACLALVGRDGGFAVTARVVPRRTVVEAAAFAAFIRAQHPSKPAEHCAALTGIALDSVEKMLKRETLPNGRNFLLCVVAYGPSLIAAVLPEAEETWLIGAQILADQSRLEGEMVRAREEMARNSGRWTLCGIGFGALA